MLILHRKLNGAIEDKIKAMERLVERVVMATRKRSSKVGNLSCIHDFSAIKQKFAAPRCDDQPSGRNGRRCYFHFSRRNHGARGYGRL